MDSFRSLYCLTPPTVEPATLAEAKLWLKSDITADDALITTLITTARMAAENYCRRAFYEQTWVLTLDDQPSEIELPMGYIKSITSIKTYAEAGTSTTETASHYYLTVGENGIVTLKPSYIWTTTTRTRGMLEITYVVGWSAYPQDIKDAVRMLIAHYYQDRGDAATFQIPEPVKALLNRYKKVLV